MTIVIIVALCLAAGFWGVDSRPTDLLQKKPARWFAGTPRA